MAPGLPRNHLSSSTLIRLLQDQAVADGADAKQTFAERLSQWLGWTDAITLSAALSGGSGPIPSTVAQGRFLPARGVFTEFDRVRADLAQAIEADQVIAPQPPAPKPRPKPSKRPAAVQAEPTPAAPADDPADFAPCRRQLLAHQRTMTERIGALRADVRLALTNQSAALGQLAALDAVMDDALAAREKHVLSQVPALLERRFDKLRRTHAADATHAAPPGIEEPGGDTAADAATAAPPPWRIACGRDMQDVLLAELDLRLQPVHGMIEALDHQLTRQQ